MHISDINSPGTTLIEVCHFPLIISTFAGTTINAKMDTKIS